MKDIPPKVIEYIVERLMHSRFYEVTQKEYISPVDVYPQKQAVEIINDIIGLGFGFTFQEIEGFWCVDYRTGINVSVLDRKLISHKIQRKLIIHLSQKWLENKMTRNKQLQIQFE